MNYLKLNYDQFLINDFLRNNVVSTKNTYTTIPRLNDFVCLESFIVIQNSSFVYNLGYFLLAGRCRNDQESKVVQEVIEKHLKRKINLDNLFGHPSVNKLSDSSKRILDHVMSDRPDAFNHVVFTYNMRRLAVLVGRALEFNEPVLLVGETGYVISVFVFIDHVCLCSWT